MLIEIIFFLLIINVIAFVHEFGHFYFARRAGIKVSEFGFGLPPRIIGVYKDNGKYSFVFGSRQICTPSTIFSVNWLPFGAYNNVNSSREEGKIVNSPPEDDMDSKTWPQRFAVAIGGVFFNILFAALIFYFLIIPQNFVIYQEKIFPARLPFGQQTTYPMVASVAADSPAQKAGLQPLNMIIGGNGQEFGSTREILDFIKSNEGKEVELKIRNFDTHQDSYLKVIPDTPLSRPKNRGALGVSLYEVSKIDYGSDIFSKIFSGILHALNLLVYVFEGLWQIVGLALASHNFGVIAESTAGPVGLFAVVKIAMASGWGKLLNLTAMISIAIAATNLLPLPALDGGRIIFLSYEALAKKKPPVKLEYNINLWGLIGLIILSILILFKDLFQFKDIIFK